MLKIVVFDSGFGGELLADKLEAELPVVEVIRVIDWRNAKHILRSPHKARKVAEKALKPYFGKVDLIILANYLLSATSLKYFRRRYRGQKFVGLKLKTRRVLNRKTTLVLTTKAVSRTLAYLHFVNRLRPKTVCLDAWPPLIDDGELTRDLIKLELGSIKEGHRKFVPQQIMLACGQFSELTPQIREIFGHNVRIIDGFDAAIMDACRALNIRGRVGKKKRE